MEIIEYLTKQKDGIYIGIFTSVLFAIITLAVSQVLKIFKRLYAIRKFKILISESAHSELVERSEELRIALKEHAIAELTNNIGSSNIKTLNFDPILSISTAKDILYPNQYSPKEKSKYLDHLLSINIEIKRHKDCYLNAIHAQNENREKVAFPITESLHDYMTTLSLNIERINIISSSKPAPNTNKSNDINSQAKTRAYNHNIPHGIHGGSLVFAWSKETYQAKPDYSKSILD